MTATGKVCSDVEAATSYLDVYGGASGSTDELYRHVKQLYRKLARVIHPDSNGNQGDRRCENAFRRLAELRHEADEAIKRGDYGIPRYIATISTRKCSHAIKSQGPSGEVADTYIADTSCENRTLPSLCKVARDARDNDLLKAEAAALKRMRGPDANPQWIAFVPELLDSFQVNGGSRRAGNAIALLEGFVTLDQVKRTFVRPFDPLHAVWIWRRLLVALGHAHDNKVLHGAVLPRHVMIHPELHGLVLVDWCYSTISTDDEPYTSLLAVVPGYQGWYPQEILSKQSPTTATDLSFATRTLIDLMDGNPITGNLPSSVPPPLRAFFKGCLSASPAARPQSAWLLLQEFDELLESMGAPYYPRRFRPLHVPHRYA